MKATKELEASHAAWVKANTPAGTRLEIGKWEIEVLCDGFDPDFYYQCGYDPGHTGSCHTFNKSVDFVPVTGGPGIDAIMYLKSRGELS